MRKVLHSFKFRLLVLAVIVITASLYTHHIMNRYKVLDRDVFNDFVRRIDAVSDSGGFESQEQLSSFIMDWADEIYLDCKRDSYGNIIFDKPAIDRKKNVSPTLVMLDIDYLTAADNAELLASAASIAASDLNSGRKTVVFANNELESNIGIMHLNKKYIGNKSKVIYLDYGPKAYVSVNSYAKSYTEISIPATTEISEQDTAIKIHIDGIQTSSVGPEITDQPDPLNEFGLILNRLKSRSIEFRVADFSVQSYDNMYPSGMDATILINSYSIPSYTKYLDQRIKTFLKSADRHSDKLKYTYEIVENEQDIPVECYDSDTGDLLARILYTINNGTYEFADNDPVPESNKVGDIYGINCMMDLEKRSGSIVLRNLSEAYDETFLNRIVMDNRAAAELNECKFKNNKITDAFRNEKNSLLRTFRNTYSKVYDASDNPELAISCDDRFTSCSYIASKNPKSDIIHLRLSAKSAAKLTNTIMCYIKAKGNTFSL